VERIPRNALHHPSDEDLLLHPSEQRPLAGDPESAGDPGTLHPRLLSPPPSGTTCGGADCLRRDELRFIVSHISDSSCGPPPAHRDKAAMNGAQLLITHGDYSGLVSGPPAFRRLNILLTSGNEGALPGPECEGPGPPAKSDQVPVTAEILVPARSVDLWAFYSVGTKKICPLEVCSSNLIKGTYYATARYNDDGHQMLIVEFRIDEVCYQFLFDLVHP